jgi:hypothetical protein
LLCADSNLPGTANTDWLCHKVEPLAGLSCRAICPSFATRWLKALTLTRPPKG